MYKLVVARYPGQVSMLQCRFADFVSRATTYDSAEKTVPESDAIPLACRSLAQVTASLGKRFDLEHGQASCGDPSGQPSGQPSPVPSSPSVSANVLHTMY